MKRSSINYNRQYLHGPRAWKASTHRSGEKPQIAFAASIAAAVLAVGSLVLYDAYLCIAVIPELWGFVVWSVQAFVGAWLWEFYGAKNE